MNRLASLMTVGLTTIFVAGCGGSDSGSAVSSGSIAAPIAVTTMAFPPPAEGLPAAGKTGGPYVAADLIKKKLLESFGCRLGVPPTENGTECSSVTVRFFDRYGDAWDTAVSDWHFEAEWATDHEMYAMTLHGKVVFVPKGPGGGLITADHWNVLVDATTGVFVSNGTQGTPLAAA